MSNIAQPGENRENLEKATMQVVQDVRIRNAPRIADETHVDWLRKGGTVEIIEGSDVQADNYLWLQHTDKEHWSAEQHVSGELYLLNILEPYPAETPEAEPLPTIKMRVLSGLNVRAAPSLNAEIVGGLSTGEVIDVVVGERPISPNHVWVQHSNDKWSAQVRISDGKAYLKRISPAELDDLPEVELVEGYGPQVRKLFKRFPVSPDKWSHFYYFGNTVVAYKCGEFYNYDDYAQGLHAALDFGNTTGASVFAGVDGTFLKIDTSRHQHHKVYIESGDYLLIYQHVMNEVSFQPGDIIRPDTKIAEVMPSTNCITENGKALCGLNHLHIEVRKGNKILNPLMMMSPGMAEQIINKFPPTGNRRFLTEFGKWTQPLDQPIIELGNPEQLVPKDNNFQLADVTYKC